MRAIAGTNADDDKVFIRRKIVNKQKRPHYPDDSIN